MCSRLCLELSRTCRQMNRLTVWVLVPCSISIGLSFSDLGAIRVSAVGGRSNTHIQMSSSVSQSLNTTWLKLVETTCVDHFESCLFCLFTPWILLSLCLEAVAFFWVLCVFAHKDIFHISPTEAMQLNTLWGSFKVDMLCFKYFCFTSKSFSSVLYTVEL